jgi:hypothetical protein
MNHGHSRYAILLRVSTEELRKQLGYCYFSSNQISVFLCAQSIKISIFFPDNKVCYFVLGQYRRAKKTSCWLLLLFHKSDLCFFFCRIIQDFNIFPDTKVHTNLKTRL